MPGNALRPGELIVDSFAGGGGASEGIRLALGRDPDIAINHDAEAIAMHRVNHPTTTHYNESVWAVDPKRSTKGKPVGLMWLSPDCTDFSKAKGGKPISRKRRALAFIAVRWARALGPRKPRVIVLENVEEFEGWGPLLKNDKRNPKLIGHTFRTFVGRLRGLGYEVEWRQMRACDFGAPTMRKRLFLIARCDGLPIVWPTPTHGPGRPLPWRTAAECIDFTLPTPSIFLTAKEAKAYYKATGTRIQRPLKLATMRRIGRGIVRFVIDCAEPFIVPMTHDNKPESIREPLSTITTQNNKHQLVTPFLARVNRGEHDASGKKRGQGEHPVDAPIGTIETSNGFGLVAPTLIQSGYGEREGQAPRSLDINQPLGTVVGGGNKHALVSAFLAKHNGGHEATGQRLTEPMHTVVANDQKALISSHLLKLHGSSLQGQLFEEPAPTIRAGGQHLAEVRAFLIAYFGTDQKQGSLREPLRTVTAKDRVALVTVRGQQFAIADIGLRMLATRERFRAQGFRENYIIDPLFEYVYEYTNKRTGKVTERRVTKPLTAEAQGRMCGNSVCPPQAAAIIRVNLLDAARQERVA